MVRIGNAQTTSLDRTGIFPVRAILGFLVAAPEPEGERHGRQHRRDDDRQHDRGGIDEDGLLGLADRADRIENTAIAGGERQEKDGTGDQARRATGNSHHSSNHQIELTKNPPSMCSPIRRPANLNEFGPT